MIDSLRTLSITAAQKGKVLSLLRLPRLPTTETF